MSSLAGHTHIKHIGKRECVKSSSRCAKFEGIQFPDTPMEKKRFPLADIRCARNFPKPRKKEAKSPSLPGSNRKRVSKYLRLGKGKEDVWTFF